MKMKDVLRGMSTPKLIATLFESLRDRNVAESREFIKEATVELSKRPPIQGPKGDKGDPGVGAPLINNLNDGGTEAALTAEMGKEIKSRLDEIKKVINPITFGAKFDGITDDTIALQNSINSLTDGDIWYIPKGVSVFTRLNFNKSNIVIESSGSLKVKDGHKELDGNFIIYSNNKNIVFNNFIIDGNSDTITIDPTEYGIYTLLTLGENVKDVIFNNAILKNSVLSSIVFNGFANNVSFNNLNIANCGEHPFYTSGGGNKNIFINNLTVTGFGCSSVMSEDKCAYVFKLRNDKNKISSGNISVKNAIIDSKINNNRKVSFIGGDGVDGFIGENIKLLDDKTHLIIATSSQNVDMKDIIWSNMQFNMVNINGGCLVYNLVGIDATKLKNNKISNLTLNSPNNEMYEMGFFDEYVDCEFNNCRIKDRSIDCTKNRNLLFRRCRFINYTQYVLNSNNLLKDIKFEDSFFEFANTENITYAIFFNGTHSRELSFHRCNGDFSKCDYFVNYIGESTNILIDKCNFIQGEIFGSNYANRLFIFDSVITGNVLTEIYTTKFNKVIMNNVFKEDYISKTKTKGSVIFQTGDTTKDINVNKNIITLAPSMNLEHIIVYPNKHCNYVISCDNQNFKIKKREV